MRAKISNNGQNAPVIITTPQTTEIPHKMVGKRTLLRTTKKMTDKTISKHKTAQITIPMRKNIYTITGNGKITIA